jgi:hypothetical protein
MKAVPLSSVCRASMSLNVYDSAVPCIMHKWKISRTAARSVKTRVRGGTGRSFTRGKGRKVYYINSTLFLGLSVWILGFAMMTAGWLVDVLFESYGAVPAKIFYKTGAILVAVPVIYLLWKTSALLYRHRIDLVLFLRSLFDAVQVVVRSI